MSREHLYKAKRVNWRELPKEEWWVTGYYACINDCQFIFSGKCNERYNIGTNFSYVIDEKFEVDPETVCEYIGSTDKNDRKIFEGDVLSAHLDDQYPEDITYVQIKWNGFSWCMREGAEDDVMSEYDCDTFEICGSIFDNPELLKGDGAK